jgi:hypothetical protein
LFQEQYRIKVLPLGYFPAHFSTAPGSSRTAPKILLGLLHHVLAVRTSMIITSGLPSNALVFSTEIRGTSTDADEVTPNQTAMAASSTNKNPMAPKAFRDSIFVYFAFEIKRNLSNNPNPSNPKMIIGLQFAGVNRLIAMFLKMLRLGESIRKRLELAEVRFKK